MLRNLGLAAVIVVTGAMASVEAMAQASGQGRLVFVGADPAEGRPGDVGSGLSVLSFVTLPESGRVEFDFIAALLQANPVSTFVASPEISRAQTGGLSVVLDLGLAPGADGETQIVLAGETMPISEFADRFKGLVDAFNPIQRQLGFVRIADPSDLLPAALDGLSVALEGSGLGMSVLMVGSEPEACEGPRPGLLYAMLAGLADRKPFGDGNGQTTASEASAFLTQSLERDADRGEPCAARYSILLEGLDGQDAIVGETPQEPLIPDIESKVYMETFDALFLMSSDAPDPIRAFLQSCTFCPNEAELTDRLQTIAARELSMSLEADVWEAIHEDTSPARLQVYMDNCQVCVFADEAAERIKQFEAADASRANENAEFEILRAARDLSGLRTWRESCVACDFADEADALIADIIADGRYEAEKAALFAATGAMNASMISLWLETCELCDARSDAEAALANLEAQALAAEPCIQAAGLPQQGGPRLLADIDVQVARAACNGVLEQFPGAPNAMVGLGRVEQASGDVDAAAAAYEVGMAAGMAESYGLAAHLAFAPGDGSVADYVRAETLAQQGYEQGDWLSGEVLAVVYSRELVPGKGAADALEIATAQAEDGNPVAQFFTGYFNLTGSGTDVSQADALLWFERSVAQGYLHSNSFLADLLETGTDDKQPEPERAAELYWTALEGGDQTALGRLTDQLGERSNTVVREIQTRLRAAGVFNGQVDGIGGNGTASAVERFVASLADANAG
jgi:TPR repeat protein